jgi:Na+/H+ antiporter NhaD/arsenite permease-like protein
MSITLVVFLLSNARFVSRTMLERVDWDLLILFVGLFIVKGRLRRRRPVRPIGGGVAEMGREPAPWRRAVRGHRGA